MDGVAGWGHRVFGQGGDPAGVAEQRPAKPDLREPTASTGCSEQPVFSLKGWEFPAQGIALGMRHRGPAA